MIGFLKKILSGREPVDYKSLISEGATIVDVRTRAEYANGHIKGSLNIPLDQLNRNLDKLKNKGPIILCCASGMRSGSAARMLKSNGFSLVYNAGSWYTLQPFSKK